MYKTRRSVLSLVLATLLLVTGCQAVLPVLTQLALSFGQDLLAAASANYTPRYALQVEKLLAVLATESTGITFQPQLAQSGFQNEAPRYQQRYQQRQQRQQARQNNSGYPQYQDPQYQDPQYQDPQYQHNIKIRNIKNSIQTLQTTKIHMATTRMTTLRMMTRQTIMTRTAKRTMTLPTMMTHTVKPTMTLRTMMIRTLKSHPQTSKTLITMRTTRTINIEACAQPSLWTLPFWHKNKEAPV